MSPYTSTRCSFFARVYSQRCRIRVRARNERHKPRMTKTRQEPLPGEVNAGRSVKRPPLGRWWGTGGAKKTRAKIQESQRRTGGDTRSTVRRLTCKHKPSTRCSFFARVYSQRCRIRVRARNERHKPRMTKTRQEPLPGEVNAGRSVKRPPEPTAMSVLAFESRNK